MYDDVASYLVADHQRLGELLARAATASGAIDREAYAEFRRGLLRHIAIEEKILLPAAERARGGQPLPIAARLRLDHGALAALLVPTPTAAIVRALHTILAAHNQLEEGAAGVYRTCERLAGEDAPTLLAEIRAAPAVSVAPHNDGPRVLPAIRRALARAGHGSALANDPALVTSEPESGE